MRIIPSWCLAALVLVASTSSVLGKKKNQSEEELERAILLEFFESTNGRSWNDNYGWAGALPNVCMWSGVECLLSPADIAAAGGNIVSGRNPVVGLHLADNFLSGRTPASLWQLSSLRTIDLSFNPSLDVDFGSLGSLEASKVPPLESVYVQNTATTSVKGVGSLSETISEIILSENNFESQFPPDLLDLRRLTHLSCANCKLRGAIPDAEDQGIANLSQLRVLDLYDNDLTGTFPDGLGKMVHLRDIILAKNQFHGKLPDFVNDELVLLEQFWVNYNDFTGTIPPFDKQPSIQKLYLNGNSFTGNIPDTFLDAAITGPENAGEEIMINFGKNEFSGVIPTSLDRLSVLPIVWRFGGNEWEGVSTALCDNIRWNDGGVAAYGCPALVCPPGSYSEEGYHTEENPCEACSTAVYWGTYECFDNDDRAVLQDLYAKLGGQNWIHNEGWATAPRFVADDDWSEEWNDYCDWYGVECWNLGDAKDGRVRKLQLSNNNLQGNIPETIFSIEHMTTLDVSNNPNLVATFRNVGHAEHLYSVNVAGTQTKDFDGIQHANDFFKRLFADNTPIAGTLPAEITRVHNLEVLSLQGCDMNGELPVDLFAMSSLKELYLAQNNFQGFVPDRWNALRELKVVSLAQNAFRGNLPESFGFAPNLKALTVKDQVTKGGGFTGSIPSFSKSRSLTNLILSDNKFDGTLPQDLLLASETATDHFHVDLKNNKITGPIHGNYERFNRLDLYLEGNLISEIDERLCNNPLWMNGGVGAYGCDAILCPAGTGGGRRQYMDDGCLPCENADAELTPSIAYFGQSACSIANSLTPGGPNDVGITPVDLPPNQSLERAVLESFFESTGGADAWKSSDGWMTDSDFCTWFGIDCDENGSVASIQLGENGLKGTVSSLLWTLPNLVHLKIFGNDISIEFTGIHAAKNLKTLGLDSTNMRNLEGIGRARSLTTLNVAYNNLVGNLPEELSRLINLEVLDLSNNKFTGEMPFWLKKLAKLSSLSLANNKIGGSLPDFSTFGKLSLLDLSNNNLVGTVPKELLAGAPADEKVVVDLSHNKIEGIVPGELSRLSRLSLQLEDNQITGIDGQICDMAHGWNDFANFNYGCDGILCPAGTWNSLGKQTSDDVPCAPCKKYAKYMGSTTCGKDTTTVSAASSTSLLAVALAIALACTTLL